METRQLIRIEHPSDGWGIFCTPSWSSRLTAKNILPELCCRHCDGFADAYVDCNPNTGDWMEFSSSHYCAFKSIEHIQEWVMKEEFAVLFENGFRVYLLEVSNWNEGRDNIVFRKEDVLSKKDISDLFLVKDLESQS